MKNFNNNAVRDLIKSINYINLDDNNIKSEIISENNIK